MAHFRAEIRGARGVASRLGHKNTGISTLLQTWGYDVRVVAWRDELVGIDKAAVELVNHTTGHVIPLLDLNLSAEDHRGVVTFVYRTVDEKTTGPGYQPRTGQLCSCHPGIERDNCAACEGAGIKIDFAAIRARTSGKESL